MNIQRILAGIGISILMTAIMALTWVYALGALVYFLLEMAA